MGFMDGIKRIAGLESTTDKMKRLQGVQKQRIQKAIATRPVNYQSKISQQAPCCTTFNATASKMADFGNTGDRKMDSQLRGELGGSKGPKEKTPFTFG